MKPPRAKRKGAIDWAAVREQLARARAATAVAVALPPDRAKAVLDERARILARPPAEGPPPGGVIEVATFLLGSERYAIEAKYVREVVRLEDFTAVPGAPEFLLGVTNLRGEILAVVDLRKFFGVPAKGLTDLSRLIVLGGQRAEFGILADQAEALLTLRAPEVLEPPESVAGIGREYLRGVTREALIVLDGARLLSDPRLVVDQAATPAE